MASPFISAAARRLEGKVGLITGLASGIGGQTARLFAGHGAKVAIADIQDELGRSVTEALGPSESIFVHCNYTNEAQMKNAVDKAVATYGKLDIVFNNAGISDDNKPSIINNDKASFDRVLSINVTGVFLGIKHSARVVIPTRNGSIILTSSVASGIACRAAHAVVGLTRNKNYSS